MASTKIATLMAMSSHRLKTLRAYWNTFSFVGLILASLFFAASVTPSLLPRTWYVQGVLSGFAFAAGYGVGVGLLLLHQFLELPRVSQRVEVPSKVVTSICAVIVVVFFAREMTVWQNSIRERMEMPLVETAYPYRTVAVALITSAAMIAIGRIFIRLCSILSSWFQRMVPPRVSIVFGTFFVCTALIFVGNGIVLRGLLSLADSSFQHTDALIDDGVEQPIASMATGSIDSLVAWDTIGRQGKNFIATGPTKEEVGEFCGREALAPIRVYVGMNSAETPEQRAELALRELIRVRAFERSILVVATPTGTGWLDPGAVDTLEFLHAGDTAIVSTQYSYLPSWITIAIDPRRSITSAQALFDVVYQHWRSLPKAGRPKLYLHGLSLGALGSELSTDLYAMLEDPVQGAVWSGPPFPSRQWKNITTHRNAGTPEWLPVFRDGRLVRFTSQENALADSRPWGPIRNVYIQYASDPMIFFSTSLIYRKPSWLDEPRGPDVSPHLRWYPMITAMQIAFDLPMSTSVPVGYGHNYAPHDYINAWLAVTDPVRWTDIDTVRLKARYQTR